MRVLVSFLSKLILLPFALVYFVFAYGLFMLDPSITKFSFKMVR